MKIPKKNHTHLLLIITSSIDSLGNFLMLIYSLYKNVENKILVCTRHNLGQKKEYIL
jgi:hypothetical protein